MVEVQCFPRGGKSVIKRSSYNSAKFAKKRKVPLLGEHQKVLEIFLIKQI